MDQRICPICKKLQPMDEQKYSILVGDLVFEKTDYCCTFCGCFAYSETKPKQEEDAEGKKAKNRAMSPIPRRFCPFCVKPQAMSRRGVSIPGDAEGVCGKVDFYCTVCGHFVCRETWSKEEAEA